jgi:hypothetical protein
MTRRRCANKKLDCNNYEAKLVLAALNFGDEAFFIFLWGLFYSNLMGRYGFGMLFGAKVRMLIQKRKKTWKIAPGKGGGSVSLS